MIRLTIDSQQITMVHGRTILEACREYGVNIPTLCYHPALEPYGACRLCIVEVQRDSRPAKLVAACTQPCEEGMVVRTNSKAVRRNRRTTAELLLAGSFDVPEIIALADALGVEKARFKLPAADACVLCGLCVRACREIVGISAISMINRGIDKQVSSPFQVASASCIGCGTCVLICPTGKMQLRDVTTFQSAHRTNRHNLPFYCQLCGDATQISMNGHEG